MAQTEFKILSKEEFIRVSQSNKFSLSKKNDVILVEKRESRGRSSNLSNDDYESFEDALNRDSFRFYKDLDLGAIHSKKTFDEEFNKLVNNTDKWSFGSKNNKNFGESARKSYIKNKDLIRDKIAFRFYSYRDRKTGKFISKEMAEKLGAENVTVSESWKELKTGKLIKRSSAKTKYASSFNKGIFNKSW